MTNPLARKAAAVTTAVRVMRYVQKHPAAYRCCIREAIPASNLDAVLLVMERSGWLKTRRRTGGTQRAYRWGGRS